MLRARESHCKFSLWRSDTISARKAPDRRRSGQDCPGGHMAIEDDDKPRKKVSHEIGQDLSLLSVEELTERVALLNTEIARLEEAATKKRASRDAADSFFKK
ncbi:hypothetical protein BJS_08100 [Bradyrhizobium japonicum SEMIA 5079]|nr:hypothetical protein BJS_08100 [Bradyrhizobium japonicum SEMIA 5079]